MLQTKPSRLTSKCLSHRNRGVYFVAFGGCKPCHNVFNVTRLTLIHRDRSTQCKVEFDHIQRRECQ